MSRNAKPLPWTQNALQFVLPALLVLTLVAIWQLAADTDIVAEALDLKPVLFPSPAEIATALWESRSLLADNAWATLQEMLLGFAVAVVAGLGFAVAMHLFATLRRAAYPLVVGSQTIPIVAIAPILVVWFGFGIEPKLAIVALVCFFPITVTTIDGLRSVDREAIKMMRTLDASHWQILRRVEAPSALPQAFSGAKVAVAFTGIAALFGELAGGSSGLGILIRQDSAHLETARMFASVFVLSAMALALFGLVTLAERRIVDWR